MIALLAALALQAAAPDWQLVGPSPGGTAYFDPGSVVAIDAARRRLRVRLVYDPVKPNGVASSIALGEFDCVNHNATIIEVQHLNSAGVVIATEIIPPAQRRAEPNPPRGPEEVMLGRICGRPPQ